MANEDGGNCKGKPGYLAHICTIAFFTFAAIASPLIITYYVAVRIFKKLWMKLLANRFPHMTFVESDSIRTLLDTHRNQGVINVFMTLKGTCQPLLIQQALMEHVVGKKDRMGNLRFPKLRAILVSCWGNYAWMMSSQFDVENHLIVGNPKFRGRPITEQNIQEHISEIVTKYLPSNAPPWQIILIPNIISNEQKYGILIRVHHLLMEEEGDLNIGDFLLLQPEADIFVSPCHSPTNEDVPSDVEEKKIKNPLCDILQTPRALPSLYYRLCDSFSNRWNEFISDYDPIESPKMLQKYPGVFHCAAIFLITFTSTCKEFRKHFSQNKSDPATYVAHFMATFHREAVRRGLTPVNVLFSGFVTFNPVSVFLNAIKFFLRVNISICIKFPVSVYNEYMAFRSCLKREYYMYPSTVVTFLCDYLPLFYTASKELAYISKLIYWAPKTLIRELFFRDKNKEQHHLQTMSTCGRKVVSWSEPVSRKWIKDIALSHKVSETEVLLAMTTCCLKEYFIQADLAVPNAVLATARTVTCDTLLASIANNGCCYHHLKRYGSVYLSLPVGDSCMGNGSQEIQSIAEEMNRVCECQGALYALSGWRSYITQSVPSVLARIALNYGSRKYSVALTEVAEGTSAAQRITRWDHEVVSLLCWRPPQGNISMSLTIQSYGGAVRLGVMTDALMSPQHQAPARHWTNAALRFHTHLPRGTQQREEETPH